MFVYDLIIMLLNGCSNHSGNC